MEATKKELFMATIEDVVADLFYYDRKNDDELGHEDVGELVESGQITLTEILETFKNEIRKNYPKMKD